MSWPKNKDNSNSTNFDEEIPKNIDTYLGQKGYTIPKSQITIKLQYFIKEQLTVKPYVPGAPIANTNTFPAFRESDKKLYVPRYYGQELFGLPKEIKITEGENIHIPFHGKLRDVQEPVVEKYLNHVKNGGGGLLELPCGFGKTSISLYITSQLKKKTLVIVHKEFLMNQWIERIQQFLPEAKIGRIQGPVIDIEGKDIVLAMLQSLSMKDYPSTMFDCFGFTIIDEVHHISSEVFSCALFKLVTKYMLGLSATMNRKDGTTKVFKMFLGDVVYKTQRSKDEEVVVRGITYETNDEEFNETKFDFRGNPAFSTMISKLCTFSHRSEFILKVLSEMLKENPNQQIMILAHNKNLLAYLFDAISHRNIATVGYYVGGMKEAALKESETKRVIIATYSMAAEALDIKTLTTLIMATPKTDIEQAVGRILREKHSQPIVVDIIDKHEMFQKQWLKRKRFYKSQNYKIIETSSFKYVPDASTWKVTYEPSRKKECKEEIKTTKTTNKNKSFSDRSITSDSDEDEDEEDNEGNQDEKKDKYSVGKCLLFVKKKI
jgi:superfamily II DNA or RNA helicase